MKADIATAHLEMVLASIPDDGVIMEWGSGGSTTFFAENKPEAAMLVSIENDLEWWNKVVAETYDEPATAVWYYPPSHELRFIGPYGSHFRENPVAQTEYICAEPVLEVLKRADVIFVDGTARGACLAVAAFHKKPSCVVWLHDAQRDWYDWTFCLYGETELIDPAEGHGSSLRRFQ